MKKLPPTPEKGVLNYLEAKTVKAHGQYIRTAALYYGYRKFAWLIGSSTVSAKRFYSILEEHGYRRKHTQHGKVYRDVRLIN